MICEFRSATNLHSDSNPISFMVNATKFDLGSCTLYIVRQQPRGGVSNADSCRQRWEVGVRALQ